MNRKQRRAMKKNKGAEALESEMALFGKLPDECMTCDKPFDKKDKEMAFTWSVVVHKATEEVRLYCPDCWERANSIVADMKDRIEKRMEENEADL